MTSTAAIHSFKSPFIYIRDIDETHSPIRVREYSEVQHKEDGNWPQFGSVANEECPFKRNGAMEIMDLCSEEESVGEETTVEERRERVDRVFGEIRESRRGRR
jgi:regulatory subunit for Cdc7p protein kinase